MNREKLKAEEAEQDQRNKLIKSRPKPRAVRQIGQKTYLIFF